MNDMFCTVSFRRSQKGSLLRSATLASALFLGGASIIQAAEPAAQSTIPEPETTAEGIGLQAASVLSSALYLPFKGAMALAGGLAGGIAYAFSLGDMNIAEGVWGPSVYGTYLLTPEHLTGDKPIEFFGTVPAAPR
jgi:hypothetical protein